MIYGGLSTWVQASTCTECLRWIAAAGILLHVHLSTSATLQGVIIKVKHTSQPQTVSLVEEKKSSSEICEILIELMGLFDFLPRRIEKLKKKNKPKKSGVSWVKCESWEVWHKH